MKEYSEILDDLRKNPMFHLSLGSKELFHSNFLEFLWEEDKISFLKMLNEILGYGGNEQISQMINSQEEYILDREKKKFDICIYHYVEKVEIYDIVIENKVKSVPYKTQLDRYVKTVGNNHNQNAPVYILLSLAKEFPDKADIQNEGKWKIVSYDSLLEVIRNNYVRKSLCKRIGILGKPKLLCNSYIEDYCKFIQQLCHLQECIVKEIDSSLFYNEKIINKFETFRLHDLYHKLRGSYFIGKLFKELNGGTQTNAQIKIDKEERSGKDGTIFLSSTMNNGKSTITAAILKEKSFYTIQIEGEQYRHMFNTPNLAKDCSISLPPKKQSKVDEKKLKKALISNSHAFDFINFRGNFDVKNTNINVSGTYCKYAPDCVYRYKLYNKDITFQNLLDKMKEDVIATHQVLFLSKNNN